MRELRPGLWHWKAPHPEWRPGEPWDRDVSSYAIVDRLGLVLLDPLDPPAMIEKLAAEREAAVVLTAPWHERETRRLVERFELPVYTPLPDTAEYLMQTYGITAEQAGDGSPDLVWLLKQGMGEARVYAPGERWLALQRITREQVVEGLRPLLELPVEHVLATHGGPCDGAALERALG